MKRILLSLLIGSLLSGVLGCAPSGTTKTGPGEDAPGTLAIAPPAAPSKAPEHTPEVTQAPTPAPTSTPLPGVPYKTRVNTLNVRSGPSQEDSGNIIREIGFEEPLYVLEDLGAFSKVQLQDGTLGYCYTEFIVPAEETLYAYLKKETAQKTDISTGQPVFAKDGVTPVNVVNELIDLRLYLPEAAYELLFATKQNVIGEPLYTRAIPLMQKETAKKLQKAFDRFREDGFTLKVYDAYRPLSVQRRLFKVVKNSHWIANPDTTASNHNRGCAVDMSLLDQDGNELAFPTPMHTFSEAAARTSETWTQEQRENVDYMTKVMEDCGFAPIKSEWWHFADTNSKKYMTTDIDLGRLTMLPKEPIE